MTKKRIALLCVVLLALGIKIFSLFPDAVERYYSTGLYPVISRGQRILFGWLPFSVGDIFYGLIVIYLIYKLVDLVKRVRKKTADRNYWLGGLKRLVIIVLLVYTSFNLFWGLNYNRRGIARQLNLTTSKVNEEDLKAVMKQLMLRVNQYDSVGKLNRSLIANKKYLISGAISSYESLAKKNIDFNYKTPSVKPSLFSYLGNYLGYTGYYNPFSGEAHVNTTVPLFIQPYTTCHEIGHQLGYAKENEANFAGYLSAKNSTDPNFLYSVYFELYSYGRPYLYYQDSLSLKKLDSCLQPGIKRDFRELKEFYLSHANPAEKVIDKLYSQYLKANEQPSGRVTYSEVIIWMVAYYRMYGKDAL